MTEPILELEDVSKAFPGVRALDGVRLELYPGEITALVGENGAGKSTLVKILTGIYQPDAGSLRLDGRPLALASPQAALAAGITAIHQETVMFDELSVAENVFIGHQPRRAMGLVDWAAMRRRTRAILVQLEVELDPGALLKTLSVAQKHVVGIARALSVDARIVIMDEPTAALSRREIEDLFQIVRRLRAEGKAILFISHKFDEIFALCDRYVALRDGCFIGAGQLAETTQDELVTMMVGRTVDQVFPKRQVPIGEVVLEVEGLSHPTEFADIGFSLRQGEILGFYGLVGAGRSEVMQALFGITRPSRGRVLLDGQEVRITRPATRSAPASSTSRRTASTRAPSCRCRSCTTSACRSSTASRARASSMPPPSSTSPGAMAAGSRSGPRAGRSRSRSSRAATSRRW